MSFNLVVQRRRADRFVMVPQDVVAMLATGELTANAFAALVVVMAKPDGWHWSAPDIAAAAGIGRDAWQVARKVLVAVGAVVEVARPRSAGGRVRGSVLAVDWPPLHREPEKPAAGESGPTGPAIQASSLEKSAASRCCPSAALRSEAAREAKRKRAALARDAKRRKAAALVLEVVAVDAVDGGELGELVPVVDLAPEAVGVTVEVHGLGHSDFPRALPLVALPRRDPLPEVLDFLRSADRPYHPPSLKLL